MRAWLIANVPLPTHVERLADGLKVIGVYARAVRARLSAGALLWIVAFVVNLHTFRYRSLESLVGHPMCRPAHMLHGKLSIAVAAAPAKYPTPFFVHVNSLKDYCFESFFMVVHSVIVAQTKELYVW